MKAKRFILFFTINLSVLITVSAQQEIQLTHYIINPFMSNPAYSSIADFINLKAGYRNQWNGIEGSPVTSYASIHTPIGKPHWARTHPGDFHDWHGTGLFFLKDQIGPYNTTKVNLNYSYNLKIIEGGKYGYEHKDGLRISFGTFVGWTQYNTDKALLSRSKVSDWSNVRNDLSVNDPTYLILAENSTPTLDLTLGTMIYYNDRYFLGLTTSQIFQNEVSLGIDTKLIRHYFLNGMIKLPLWEHWYLIPSTMVKLVRGAPTSFDFSTRLDWEDRFFIGGGYRYQDAVTFIAGLRYKWGEKIKNFRVDKHRYIVQFYYSYDLTVNRLASKNLLQKSRGTHEITVGFLLPPMYTERNAEDTWKGWPGKRRN